MYDVCQGVCVHLCLNVCLGVMYVYASVWLCV